MSDTAPSHWNAEARLRVTSLLSVLAIGLGAALLVPESELTGDLPGDDALGTIARRSYKAGRDDVIQDLEATEALRASAMASVRSVYDLDLGVASATATKVSEAFSQARQSLRDELTQKSGRKARIKREPSEEERIEAAESGYGAFVKQLQSVVDEADYRELARLGFAEELETTTLSLVSWALGVEVVSGRELLIAEHGSPLWIRPVNALGAGEEREVSAPETIADVASMRAELERIGRGEPALPGARPDPELAADVRDDVRHAAAALAVRLVRANLTYNELETSARRLRAAAGVKPVVLQYARGEKIVGDGERIEKRHLIVFRQARERARGLDAVQIRVGAGLFAMLMAAAIFRLARRTLRGFRPTKRDVGFLAATLIGNLAAHRGVETACELMRDKWPWLTHENALLVMPLLAGTMLVRLLRSGESSIVFALVIAPLAALQLSSPLPVTLGLLASAVAVDRIGRTPGSPGLVAGAIMAGLSSAAAVLAISAFSGHGLGLDSLVSAGLAFFGTGVLSPLIAAALAPIAEALLGYASETRLAALANLNHPVLKELIIRAPGTYHHSIIVGSLAEAAARRIGAHPLLAKVGGYYHDLGKAEEPLMFYENQKTENRLEKLPPEEATAVVQQHVTRGLTRAYRARLPRAVVDVIAQHHGTRYAGAFHLRANANARKAGLPPPPDEDFHYSGPKPRSRETALVMLADAVEAASRGLPDPAPERLRALVPRVVEPIVAEGQLDGCDLTLAEVRLAIAALQDALVELHGLSTVAPLTRSNLTIVPSGPEAGDERSGS